VAVNEAMMARIASLRIDCSFNDVCEARTLPIDGQSCLTAALQNRQSLARQCVRETAQKMSGSTPYMALRVWEMLVAPFTFCLSL
jgi:hypothetical protein